LEPAVLIAARVLSALAVVATIVAVDGLHLHLVQWGGFEAHGVGVGLSFLLGTLCAVAALVLVAIAARAGRRPRFMPAFWLSSLCLLVLIGLNVELAAPAWLR
jgi:hypothetical protein